MNDFEIPLAERTSQRGVQAVARPDFNRATYTVLGLPIDAVNMAEAAAIVEKAVADKTRCFISTPNVNFAMAARHDAAFRRSVLQSDLVLADGQPIVWAARLLGTPIKDRVSGAGLFEHLLQHASRPLTVYFFGGPDGAAQAAHEWINQTAGPLRSVGFCSPGFVPVTAMSTPAFIDPINAAAPDFLVVSLGAKKGQEWIVANLDRLDAPVISHLGAVVNFTAGTLRRAPVWVQRIAAEWLWRIAQEPQLWRRYWNDGTQLLGLALRDLLPAACARVWPARHPHQAAQVSSCRVQAGMASISLAGNWSDADAGLLRGALAPVMAQIQTLQVDARELRALSPRIQAMLLQCEGAGVALRLTGARPPVEQSLIKTGCQHWLGS